MSVLMSDRGEKTWAQRTEEGQLEWGSQMALKWGRQEKL